MQLPSQTPADPNPTELRVTELNVDNATYVDGDVNLGAANLTLPDEQKDPFAAERVSVAAAAETASGSNQGKK